MCPRTNEGCRDVVLAVDVLSSFLSYVPDKSMQGPHRFIEGIVSYQQNNEHPIKHLKMDSQFNKADIMANRIERNNKTTRDILSCALAISSKNEKVVVYWLCY